MRRSTRQRRRGFFLLFGALALAGCSLGVEAPPPPSPLPAPPPAAGGLPPQSEAPSDLECVPYARLVSGLPLRGDAWTWWEGAAGRFARGARPRAGAVLVLARSERLRFGHVAVVRDVVDSRLILVDHANWVKRRVSNAMRVADVSGANDWSRLRFFNLQTGAYGQVYPAYGFIYREPSGGAPLLSSGEEATPLEIGQRVAQARLERPRPPAELAPRLARIEGER